MGCQHDIATQIVEGGANYVLGVKDNQPGLAEAVTTWFDAADAGTLDRPFLAGKCPMNACIYRPTITPRFAPLFRVRHRPQYQGSEQSRRLCDTMAAAPPANARLIKWLSASSGKLGRQP